jgi:hypothetical protein
MSEQPEGEHRESVEELFDELFKGVKESLVESRKILISKIPEDSMAWIYFLHSARSLALEFGKAKKVVLKQEPSLPKEIAAKLQEKMVVIEQEADNVCNQLFDVAAKLAGRNFQRKLD